MAFSALYSRPDAEPVDGDGIASNTGWLAWTNAVLARAPSHPELAHLAAHGWSDDFGALEHELEQLLHATPDEDLAPITAGVLAAVRARPEGAAALLVTDGEPAGDEDDEVEEGVTEAEYELLSEAARAGLTLKTVTDKNGKQTRRWVRTDTATGADHRARSGGSEDVIDRAFREPKSLTKQQVKELADHVARLPKERLRQLALAARQRIGPTKAAIADRLLASVRAQRKGIDKPKKDAGPKKPKADVPEPEQPPARPEPPKAKAGPVESDEVHKAIAEFHPALAPLVATGRLRISDVGHPAVKESLADLAIVPAEFHERMASKYGLGKIYLGNSGMPGLDDLGKYTGVAPRNWPSGYTYDNLRGCYNPVTHEVSCGNGLGGGASVMLHEYGHGVGFLTGLKDDPETSAWHKELHDGLEPYLRGNGPDSEAGRDELIAESFAVYFKGGADALATYTKSRDYARWFENRLNDL